MKPETTTAWRGECPRLRDTTSEEESIPICRKCPWPVCWEDLSPTAKRDFYYAQVEGNQNTRGRD